jgi:tripartite-type tricarboxylate transporter receptor subunit TctC
MTTRRQLLLAAAALCSLAPLGARAQGWAPDRPINLVIPFVAGGSTDVAGRILAERMRATLGQPVVVENRTGAGGNVAAEAVVRARPDGHTLLMGTTGLMTTNQHIYRRMGFDPLRDLAPVSMAFTSDLVIVVHPSVPARTLRELVELAKAEPGSLSFGSSGAGATTHTAMELFKLAAGVDMAHVPYRGSGAAMNDLLAGTIQVMMIQIAGSIGHIRDGQVRPLAVTGQRRDPTLPEVPTVAEAGLPGAEATSWGCIVAPAGTPAAAVERLSAAVREAVADPAVQERMRSVGLEGVASSPAELAAFMRAESEKWGRVVRQAGITVN